MKPASTTSAGEKTPTARGDAGVPGRAVGEVLGSDDGGRDAGGARARETPGVRAVGDHARDPERVGRVRGGVEQGLQQGAGPGDEDDDGAARPGRPSTDVDPIRARAAEKRATGRVAGEHERRRRPRPRREREPGQQRRGAGDGEQPGPGGTAGQPREHRHRSAGEPADAGDVRADRCQPVQRSAGRPACCGAAARPPGRRRARAPPAGRAPRRGSGPGAGSAPRTGRAGSGPSELDASVTDVAGPTREPRAGERRPRPRARGSAAAAPARA